MDRIFKLPVGVALFAFLTLAGLLGLLAVQSVWAQDRPPTIPDAQTEFKHAENDDSPVNTYSARDPENKPVFWTLGGPDAADFTIDRGVLRFKTLPNYEVPTDRANDEDGSGGALDPTDEGKGNNIYKVTVRFGAGGEDGTPGEPTDTPTPDEYDGDDLGELKLTIEVTNVNELGKVVISPMQPQVGTVLTAILTDQDNVAPGTGEWQWASSASMTGTFTDIPDKSRDETYRPTEDDLGKYLRVTVDYVDRAGPLPRMLKEVSDYPVREDTNTSNQDPKYPDQKTLLGGNTILRGDTDRFIRETAAADTNVGAPVTAFDDKADIEVLTYSLRDGDAQVGVDNDDNTDTPVHNDGHAASFDIHAKTGQITVSAGAMLEADGTPTGDQPNPYIVVVRAVDGDGDTQDITVTIHVLQRGEPPVIDRVYVDDIPSIGGVSAGDRVPTEMSHYEEDRTVRSPTRIDTDLESSVLDYSSDPPVLREDDGTPPPIQPATYYATDPEGIITLMWSLEGDDGDKFAFQGTSAAADPEEKVTGNSATLRFKEGPDHEDPGDKNKDNIYEVTIVVEDSTVDMDGNRHRDELPVTVKVINSTEDNQPGMVTILNRQPEVAIPLKATFKDPDDPTREVKWQWYRSVTGSTDRTRCDDYNPHSEANPADAVRYFIDTSSADIDANWQKIEGATSASYTPGYDEDSGGTHSVTTDNDNTKVEEWEGGDIELVRTTTKSDGSVADVWSEFKCLRVAVTYRDDVDRTHADADDTSTRDVDETLEGTFMGSEFPVKKIDEKNNAPVFRDADGDPVTVYRAEDILDILENTPHGPRLITPGAGRDFAADDPSTAEDDALDPTGSPTTDNDILTYSLSGRDAEDFQITGAVETEDTEATGAYAAAGEGVLSFKSKVKLDYEEQSEYKVTVTAHDPGGDSDFVRVTVNITNQNEVPEWEKHPANPTYRENGTGDVATYDADDPEESGVIYSLVTAPQDDVDSLNAPITMAMVGCDHGRFEISSTRGILRFKASPNYEDPKDVEDSCVGTPGDNKYQVTVKAEVADDENPRQFTIEEVTVEVINVNEKPVFSQTTDTLEISENPDDPEKEPTLERGYLYLLNRGVGKPAANLPQDPNLDVGIPMVAVDDDNTWVAEDYTGTGYDRAAPVALPRSVQLIDGLTYELMGADAERFHIVPATGQILTLEKLNYEIKNTYQVTVKATDPWDAYGTIPLTINVTNVDEPVVAGLLTLRGETSYDYPEDSRADLGAYTVLGATGDVAWTLEGADRSHFTFKDSTSDTSNTLQFKATPDYEMPRGQAMSNTNTYMVTVKATADGEMSMVEVTVTVTNVEEVGMVELSSMGAKVGTPLTATLTDDDNVVGVPEWQWSRINPATSGSTPITGARSASYTPVAADVGHLLKAMASYTDGEGSGKTAEFSTTELVARANRSPAFAAETATRELDENMPSGTPVGSPITATDEDGNNLRYSDSGMDAASFTVDNQGQLRTGARFNYETKNSYSVTITATDPEGATGSIAVTVNIVNVDEAGMVSLSPTQPSIGTPITASVTDPDGTPTGVTYQWSYSTTMGGRFTNYPAETTATITPVASDVGRYLRVTATYTDVYDGSRKSEMATTDGPVTTTPDQMGTVTLSPMTPVVGTAVTATLTDPDGSVTGAMWQWEKSMDMSSWMDITGATTMSYTPMTADVGYYLRATVRYTDGHSSGKMMMATTTSRVTEVPVVDPLLAKYDTDGDGIDRNDVIAAMRRYQANEPGVTRNEIIAVMRLYQSNQ